MNHDLKSHWENVYTVKRFEDVSWYQTYPDVSMQLIHELNLSAQSAIIDVGGGDAVLAETLLKEGFNDITVLDISEKALERAKSRLKDLSLSVRWIVSDVCDFTPGNKYDLWYDRAVLHFLRERKDIDLYVETAGKAVKQGGYMIIAAFSTTGPLKCSGLEVHQYDEAGITDAFKKYFVPVKFLHHDHKTPGGQFQNFLFSVFKRVAA